VYPGERFNPRFGLTPVKALFSHSFKKESKIGRKRREGGRSLERGDVGGGGGIKF